MDKQISKGLFQRQWVSRGQSGEAKEWAGYLSNATNPKKGENYRGDSAGSNSYVYGGWVLASDAWTKRLCDCQQSQTPKKVATLQTWRDVQIPQRKTQWHEDIVLKILQASDKVVHSSWSKRNSHCVHLLAAWQRKTYGIRNWLWLQGLKIIYIELFEK